MQGKRLTALCESKLPTGRRKVHAWFFELYVNFWTQLYPHTESNMSEWSEQCLSCQMNESWQSWSTITSVVMETCVILCSSKGLLDLCPVRHELLWNRVLRTTLGDFQIHLFHWSLNRFILEVIFLSPSSWFFAHFPGIKYFIAFPSFFSFSL